MNKIFAVSLILLSTVINVEAGDFFLKTAERNINFNTCITATYMVGIEYGADVEIVNRLPGIQIAKFEVPTGTIVVICDGEKETMTIAGYN